MEGSQGKSLRAGVRGRAYKMTPETWRTFSRITERSSKGLQHGVQVGAAVSRDPGEEAGSGLIHLGEKCGFLR